LLRRELLGAFYVNDVDFGVCVASAKNVHPRYPINADDLVDVSDVPTNHLFFGSRHPGGAQFTTADAAVRFVSDTIEMKVFQFLSSRNGGEVIGAGD